MGGSGAIIFCGKKRYQLIASRRFDGSGKFGFTLTREHPLSEGEKENVKNTWYEYLKIDNQIPAFEIDELELGLYRRKFKTGTVIKLYSYDLPPGSRSVISRDLNQSINEFLFEPALPIYTIDKKERYPDDRNLKRELYGLKRRLETDENKYVEEHFSEEYTNELFGKTKVTCYVFKPRVENKSAKETKESISREFFKNKMSVLFSINGQVQGHYTYEFITRALKMNLLKDFLLIHIDCTNMNYDFRKELFMASRDRLKDGDESRELRGFLADKLKKSKLSEIEKRRKDSISFDSSGDKELLKSLTKNLPLNSDMLKLLSQTFKLDQDKGNANKGGQKRKHRKEKQEDPFKPERFPSYFRIKGRDDNENHSREVTKIPLGGERTIKFESDVEDHYFDRVEKPGNLNIALLKYDSNKAEGGTRLSIPKGIGEVFNINKSSPDKGTIKVMLNPKKEVKVGDAYQLEVTLEGAGQDFNQIFWVRISEKEKPKEKRKKEDETDSPNSGLPDPVRVYKQDSSSEGGTTWSKLEEQAGIEMTHDTVVHLMVSGDVVEKVYINMDSSVFKTFKSNYKDEKQLELAHRKYWTSVYLHTLFLYTITKNKKYSLTKNNSDGEKAEEIEEYVADIFKSNYCKFILNFDGSELIESLKE